MTIAILSHFRRKLLNEKSWWKYFVKGRILTYLPDNEIRWIGNLLASSKNDYCGKILFRKNTILIRINVLICSHCNEVTNFFWLVGKKKKERTWNERIKIQSKHNTLFFFFFLIENREYQLLEIKTQNIRCWLIFKNVGISKTAILWDKIQE